MQQHICSMAKGRMYKALFLLFLIGLPAFPVHSVCAQNSELDKQQQESPTEDEVREARELVRRFITQLEQKQDVTPLMEELFVPDIDYRLRIGLNQIVPVELDSDVLTVARNEQLRKFYINSLNSIYLIGRVMTAAYAHHRRDEAYPPDNEADFDIGPADLDAVLTPEFYRLIADDPVIGCTATKALEEWRRKNRAIAESTQEGTVISPGPIVNGSIAHCSEPDDLFKIRSVERLEHYNALMERAAVLVRNRLKEMPSELAPDLESTVAQFLKGEEVNTKDPEIDISYEKDFEKAFLGYEPQTRFITATLLFVHFNMIRAENGQLRIAAVRVFVD